MMYTTLSNGIQMPMLGYGVYQVAAGDCERCVLDALKAGYRSLDTAQSYFNEKEVGSALEQSGVPREEVFLTTKVWIGNYGYDGCKKSIAASLAKLKTDYLDLVLLHQPFGDYYGAWRALEDLYEEGVLRAIGVSNFLPDRLLDLSLFSRIAPMVNQVETHPFFQQKKAQKWMEKYGIQMEAWAPFGEGKKGLFTHPVLEKIGKKYGKTTAQVMLRWLLQRNIAAIPKTTHYQRMVENLAVFDFTLSEEDRKAIGAMDRNTSSFFCHTNPETVEWVKNMVEERKKFPDLAYGA